jgi:4-amino-4-deoxy-L-arabinose transferase-like glycosyltransferase
MKTDRVFPITLAVALTLLLTTALWFRLSSLSAIPEHFADESYEGLQVARMLQGQNYSLLTMNGNLMDPFFLAMQIPFQLISKPSVGVIRSASALSGLLAIFLAFGFGSKAFDRTTALIAAILLAVLPASIVYGRIGHEYSQIPFFGVLAICFAFRANVIGLILTFLASILVHPINVFLIPIVFPVLVVQLARKYSDNPKKQRRVLAFLAIATTVAISSLGLYLAGRPIVQSNVSQRGPLDWALYLKSLEYFLLYQYALYSPIPSGSLAAQHWIFWGIGLTTLVLGTVGLVRSKQWDRLALLVGLFASLAAFHIIGGPKRLMEHGTHRYGVIFIAPIVFSLASLIQAMFTRQEPTAELEVPRRLVSIRIAGVVVVGFGLLLCLWSNWFSSFTKAGRESLSTAWNDGKDPYEQSIAVALRDHLQNATGSGNPCVIRGHGYWVNTPIEYLASWRKSVKVEQLFPTMEEFSLPPSTPVETWLAPKRQHVIEQLKQGDYLVGFVNQTDPWNRMLDTTVAASFPADQVERTVLKNVFNGPALVLYHLKPVAATLPSLAVKPTDTIAR